MSESLPSVWSPLNLFMPSGLFCLKTLDRSISYIRGVWLVFINTMFFRNFWTYHKHCRSRSDAAFWGIWSWSTLFDGTLGLNGLMRIDTSLREITDMKMFAFLLTRDYFERRELHSVGSQGSKASSSGQQWLWSACTDVRADLSLCWVHMQSSRKCCAPKLIYLNLFHFYRTCL